MPLRSSVCDGVRSQVSLELDGELSRLEQAMVERHLGRCPDCRSFRDGVKATTIALREAPLERPEFPIVVSRPRHVSLRGLSVVAGVATVVLAAGLGLSGRGILTSTDAELQSTPRPAYLDSADYDMRFIEQVREARLVQRRSGAL